MSPVTVGVLEDDKPQAELLLGWLQDDGYDTYWSDLGDKFVELLEDKQPDMLILDWELPDCEGIDVLEKLRQNQTFEGPILFATAKDSEEDIVRGLSAGADDYLVKPLRRSELLARVNALWRRIGSKPQSSFSIGPIQVELDDHRILVDGEEAKLTSTEFKLAACVLANEGKLLSRDYLLKEVWGIDAQLDTRTVDMHMSRVRRTLGIGPEIGYCIKTVYRHGYRLEKL